MSVFSHVFMYTTYMPDTHRGPKVSDPQDTELQTVVNLHLDPGKQTWILCKSHKSS